MARRYKPTADDPGLRRGYLEMYAARDARKRLSRIHSELRIRQETVDCWLRDPDFVEELRRIDQRRLEYGLMVATTLWPQIMEEVASIAAGDPEEPPNPSGKDPQEVELLLAGYKARAAQRAKIQVRAAELIARVLGATSDKPTVAIHADNVERFNELPDTVEGLLGERARLEGVLQRARERAATKAGNVDKG